MKKSTRMVIKKHGWRLDKALHYYIYFAFYDLYLLFLVTAFDLIRFVRDFFDPDGFIYKSIQTVLDMGTEFTFHRYHAKTVSLDDITKIINCEESINLGEDETTRIVPFPFAKNILLNEPDQIAVMDCPCKMAMPPAKRCEPINSCLAIGQPVVDFWLEHCDKYNVHRVSKEEAIDVIKTMRKTGHFTQAFFKVATGGSIGVICNCCEKCCGAGVLVDVTNDYQKRMRHLVKGAKMGKANPYAGVCISAPSGYSVKYDADKCVTCGKCATVCNFKAIQVNDGRREFDEVLCMGCGLCVEHCPNDALELAFIDDGKGYIPLDLDLVKDILSK